MDIKKYISGQRVALLSLGCKVNAYEIDAMRESFEDAGARIVDFSDIADIYVVNTCSVTNIADRKSRQMLNRAKHLNPKAVVVAAGCYVQTAGEKLLDEAGVDLIVGNNRKKNVTEDVAAFIAGESRNDIIDISKEAVFEEMPAKATPRCRAYIKIQDGCNQFCSYCIIPYARGRVRSRREEDIIAEVKAFAQAGCQEIVLTGIHISSYGCERDGKVQSFEHNKWLPALIKELCRIDGIERIRLGSLEPRIITPEFVKALAEEKKVCPHFHLSLQSGCDETLKRMNRHYTAQRFFEGCELLRESFDNPALTTDVIVGFPGETAEEFEASKAFLEKIAFSKMHIFKYSRRKGTVADKMPNQTAEEEKQHRSEILRELNLKLEKEYLAGFVGSIQEVLFEERIEKDGKSYYVGHNERYARIAVQTDEIIENTVRKVMIESFLDNETLFGQIVL